jgi:Ca2+-transporting ATPase
MTRPPRDPSLGLLDRAVVVRALLQGAGLLGASLGVYTLALGSGLSTDAARALAFAGLTFGNLLLVALDAGTGLPPRALFSRDFSALWAVAAVATGLISASLALPVLRHLLRFEAPPWGWLVLAMGGVGAAVLAGWELGRRQKSP